MDKLLPCPFCGGEATKYRPPGGLNDTYGIACTNVDCGASIGTYHGLNEATAAWNRRAQPENKPLTCDGCALHYEGAERDEPCLSCKRKSRADYYRSKPEEVPE